MQKIRYVILLALSIMFLTNCSNSLVEQDKDLKIRLKITNYQELDLLDFVGFGDPYFQINISDDTNTYYYSTGVFHEQAVIGEVFDRIIDVNDDTEYIRLRMMIYDDDLEVDDMLDYTRSPENYYDELIPLVDFIDVPLENTCTGVGDEQPLDKDCTITIKLEAIQD